MWLLSPAVHAQQPSATIPPVYEGNWVMEFTNSPNKGDVLRMLVTLPGKWQLLCNGASFSPSNSGAPAVGGNWSYRHEPSTSIPAGDFGTVTAGGAGVKIKHGYFVLVHWGGASEVSIKGPDEAGGNWTYNDNGGSTVWRRSKPTIDRVRLQGLSETEAPFGTMGRLEMNYAPGGGMRGNRPKAAIEVYGKDLWGQHVCWLEGTDLELFPPSPIFTKGQPSKPENIIGLRMEMVYWGNATPGRKTLHVGSLQIPFDLHIRDYPEMRKPAVGFARFADGKFQPATELLAGELFVVEVRYDKAPKPAPTTVKVGAADGDLRDVPVAATKDPLIFRSELLRVEPPTPSPKPAQ